MLTCATRSLVYLSTCLWRPCCGIWGNTLLINSARHSIYSADTDLLTCQNIDFNKFWWVFVAFPYTHYCSFHFFHECECHLIDNMILSFFVYFHVLFRETTNITFHIHSKWDGYFESTFANQKLLPKKKTTNENILRFVKMWYKVYIMKMSTTISPCRNERL